MCAVPVNWVDSFLYINSTVSDAHVNFQPPATCSLYLASEKEKHTLLCLVIFYVAKCWLGEFVCNFALKMKLSGVRYLKCWKNLLVMMLCHKHEFMSRTNAFSNWENIKDDTRSGCPSVSIIDENIKRLKRF